MFTTEYMVSVNYLHDDSIVIAAMIGNYSICRILIDMGSSTDILYTTTYDQMKLGREKIIGMITPLTGFIGHQVYPLGTIDLRLTAGEYPCEATVMVKFLVIEEKSSYNAIFGRTTLNKLKAVVSTHHLKVNFETKARTGEIKGDQEQAHKCYLLDTRM